jgi:glycosyltransferase involved in cell wall biosynthesis
MKLAVINNTVPFLRGGAEILADALTDRLARAGHQVALVRLPFSWSPPSRIADAMLAAALTDLRDVDRVIAFKFPAYLVPHDDKVVWLLHQFRQFYELWDTPDCGYEADESTMAIRDMVHRADTDAFLGSTKVFTNSAVTAGRLRKHNGLSAEVLHPPLPDPDAFANGGTGDYIFAGGRINGFKRQLLSVQAMAHTRTDVRLIVAGMPETDDDLAQIVDAARSSGCPERITIIPRFIEERHKIDLVNLSLGCVYCPVDEDSYGYVTLEGAQAAKALITTTDSGGITDLVIDGRSGMVRDPDPIQLAEAFDSLYRSRSLARMLGLGAHERALELGVSWDHVIDKLLG